MFHSRQPSAYVLEMSEYQAYWVGPDDHFVGFVRLFCQDDAWSNRGTLSITAPSNCGAASVSSPG
jgi:hypothetical protein